MNLPDTSLTIQVYLQVLQVQLLIDNFNRHASGIMDLDQLASHLEILYGLLDDLDGEHSLIPSLILDLVVGCVPLQQYTRVLATQFLTIYLDIVSQIPEEQVERITDLLTDMADNSRRIRTLVKHYLDLRGEDAYIYRNNDRPGYYLSPKKNPKEDSNR